MKKTLTTIIAATMLVSTLGAAPAQAHERTARTRVTIRVNKNVVDQGERVRFRGKLKSGWTKCSRHRRVTLYRGQTAVASRLTNRNGSYTFTRTIRATKTWRVKFAGRSWGTHPHVHRCLASSSRGVRVRVR